MITDLDLNVQNLMNLIKDNEAASDFFLGQWFTKTTTCGTFGCLCGNWAIAECRRRRKELQVEGWQEVFRLHRREWIDRDISFGLPPAIFSFLFGFQNYGSLRATQGRERPQFDKEAAINRVRKLLYYYLRKRELVADDSGEFDWRKYEELRRQEGERKITSQVLEEVGA